MIRLCIMIAPDFIMIRVVIRVTVRGDIRVGIRVEIRVESRVNGMPFPMVCVSLLM